MRRNKNKIQKKLHYNVNTNNRYSGTRLRKTVLEVNETRASLL